MQNSKDITLNIQGNNKDLFNSRNSENLKIKTKKGINEEIVKQISQEKNEPKWMLEKRLEGLKIFYAQSFPDLNVDLSDLNLNEIYFYLKPNAKNSRKWEDVPKDIKDTFNNLGIPEAEKKQLAGVGAQYESEIIYHNLKEDLEKKGVIFLNMDDAVKKYPELIKKYFMTDCVNPSLHKFSALHAAVWSGGTFIYIPKGLKVEMPLHAYFRMNAMRAGQFEHTLIIADENSDVHYIEGCSAPLYDENSLHAGCVEIYALKNSKVRYTGIENWSKNVYNLNTKKAIVYENAIMEWINVNLGSKVTMLYPCSVLKEKNSKTDYIGVAYAGKGQNQDTGCKVYHLASNTSSNILNKSISKNGGISSYRGLVKIQKGCENSKSSVACEGLILDNNSQVKTSPSMEVNEKNVEVFHEAAIQKIKDDQLFYLMSRGLNEKEAIKMIVSGFIEPVLKELSLEYAVELNRLIDFEIEKSII